MWKFLTLSIVCSSIFSSIIYANENSSQRTLKSIFKKNPHHIYFGPETFWFDVNTNVKSVKICDGKFFLGLRIGYEYLKPKAFYAGIDLLSAGGNRGFNATCKGHHLSTNKGITGFGNFEVRFGYTFSPDRGLITPFLGIGAYSFGLSHHYGFEENMVYFAGGIRSRYEVMPTLDLGVNLKILGSTDVTKKFKQGRINCTKHDNMWGGEIGVPFIWHVGTARRWDIQLEPYFLRLDFSEVQNIYGTRLLFGYRF